MTKEILLSLLLLISPKLVSQTRSTLAYGLIPYPNKIVEYKGKYIVPTQLLIGESKHFEFATKTLQDKLTSAYGFKATLTSGRADIRIEKSLTTLPKEAYQVEIRPNEVIIRASHNSGAYYDVMTLLQLLETRYDDRLSKFSPVECMLIDDAPRYSLRGLMLDPARHFLPLADVKRYIDRMVRYKYNTLQLHLTDDQGWRIEIKKHPKLTMDSKQQGKREYYTAEELKELLHYAEERGVEIIPEIDIPGHTAALLKAYSQLRIESLRDSTFVLGKTDNVMLSATEEYSYELLRDIFTEIAHIFPRGSRLHLGGDESAIERNWVKSPDHLKLMQQEGYTKPEKLMNYFFDRVYKIVDSLSFKPMQWCELDNIRMPAKEFLMSYPKNVSLVSWRMGLTPKCIELTRASGHQLLLAPGESAYLDYPQWPGDLPEHNNWGMPITSLERSYTFDIKSGISTLEDKHILGIMGTLWGEAIKNIDRAMYMTYPRALALAEIGWTKAEYRSWIGFRENLRPILNELTLSGIPHRVPYEIYL